MRASHAPAIATDPLAMRTTSWDDYGLIDSGDGRKLERYGEVRVVRPEPQCLWAPKLDAAASPGLELICKCCIVPAVHHGAIA